MVQVSDRGGVIMQNTELVVTMTLCIGLKKVGTASVWSKQDEALLNGYAFRRAECKPLQLLTSR